MIGHRGAGYAVRRKLTLLPVLALLVSCGDGGGGLNMNRVLDQFIAANPNVSSLAMLAVKDGEIVYSHTAGFMDVARTRPPTEATLYKTSSIAKLVIAVAVMQRVDAGQLDLDQDIGAYLPFAVRNPAFPDQVITARALMRHAAGLGLPDFGTVTDKLFEPLDPATVVALHPLIEDVFTPGSADYQDGIWLAGAPGSVAANSNVGLVLLTHVVEELSGMHFNDYAKANIFQPLGMAGTSHYFPDLDPDEVAALYNSSNNPVGQVGNWFYPISGLFTSTGDWANFMRAILAGGIYGGNRILQPSSVEAMLTMTAPANNQLPYGSKIGLVWREAEANPGWYGHTGAGVQMTHVTEINPARNIGYVLFTNEGQIDALVGPGSELNLTIHRWLDRLDP